MVVDNQPLIGILAGDVTIIFKILLIIFASLYFIFSLIVNRQINLMTETVITEAGALLRALGILFAGLSLGIIILFISFL